MILGYEDDADSVTHGLASLLHHIYTTIAVFLPSVETAEVDGHEREAEPGAVDISG